MVQVKLIRFVRGEISWHQSHRFWIGQRSPYLDPLPISSEILTGEEAIDQK
jgi:hypothetical protein